MLSHFDKEFGKLSSENLWMLSAIVLFSLFVGIFCFLRKCAKMPSASHKLAETDILIEIRVDDIFNLEGEGEFVISTNTSFDTQISNDLISQDSLQGQFTLKYYRNNVQHLDHDIDKQLKNHEFALIEDNRKGKKKRYEIGTVVKLQPDGQVTYFVAVADMNEHGVATGSLEKMIECLGKLWHYIGEQGELGHLIVPVLGTGRARINVSREAMIREIIYSFIAAHSENKFCEKMTIIISDNDYRKYEIDLQELGGFLRHNCKYTDFKKKTDTGKGKAIP